LHPLITTTTETITVTAPMVRERVATLAASADLSRYIL